MSLVRLAHVNFLLQLSLFDVFTEKINDDDDDDDMRSVIAGVPRGVHLHQDGELTTSWSVRAGEVQQQWAYMAGVAVLRRHSE